MNAWVLVLVAAAARAQHGVQAEGLDASLNLHNHTYCSDGSDTPERFVEVASQAGVKTVAVTDHDTVACVERAIAAGKKAGIRVVPGIEISAEDDSMHVLGLNVDIGSPVLGALMAKNRAARLDRARQTIAKLNTLKAPDGAAMRFELREILLQKVNAVRKADGKPSAAPSSTEDALLAEAGPVTRPDLALAMVAKGYVRDTRAAFDRYLGDEGGAAAELDGPDFAAAIAAIHSAGGVAVLAHPYTIYKYKQPPYAFSGKSYRDFDALLDAMIAAGLDGVEQYKANHGPNPELVDRANRDGAKAGKAMLFTPGSDYHGSSGVGQPHFDAIGVPRSMAKLILDALAGKPGTPPPARPPVLAGESGRIDSLLENVRRQRPQ